MIDPNTPNRINDEWQSRYNALAAENAALRKDAERYRIARTGPYGIACLERNPKTGNRVILFGKEADRMLDNLASRNGREP